LPATCNDAHLATRKIDGSIDSGSGGPGSVGILGGSGGATGMGGLPGSEKNLGGDTPGVYSINGYHCP
jgi:hypothetical protein